MPALDIRAVPDTPAHLAALGALLVDTVARGGSVSFMHPLDPATATAFWRTALDAAGRGERIVLGLFEGEALLGTVTLQLLCPPNQPHRCEIAKMMVRADRRGRGLASALMGEAERLAVAHGRTLIVLDTAAEEGAAPFYERLGYTRAGEIPDYAYKPHGGLCGAIVFWKRIGAA